MSANHVRPSLIGFGDNAEGAIPPREAKVNDMKLLTASWRTAVLFLAASVAQGQSLEIIDLRYRTAPEVIPIVQPLVEPGGALSGSDYKLFLRASAANVAQIKRALAEIDRQPRQLMVSVRRATRDAIAREAIAGTAVITNQGSRATVHATDGSIRSEDSNVSSVQMLEGGSARISTGQSIPMVTAVLAAGGRRPWLGASTEYKDVSTGFIVTPRVTGDRVMLDISQQAQRVSGNSSTIQSQSIDTQVGGALGQWISLGGVSESGQSRSSGTLSRSYSTGTSDMEVWVKVEMGR